MKLKEKRAVTPARTPTVRDHGIGGRVRGAAGDRERNSFGGVSSRGKGKENGRKPVGGDATPVVAEVVTVQAAALASMEALRAEAEGMRREIAEQDRLLSAYQKENEKLLERAKKVSLSRVCFDRAHLIVPGVATGTAQHVTFRP